MSAGHTYVSKCRANNSFGTRSITSTSHSMVNGPHDSDREPPVQQRGHTIWVPSGGQQQPDMLRWQAQERSDSPGAGQDQPLRAPHASYAGPADSCLGGEHNMQGPATVAVVKIVETGRHSPNRLRLGFQTLDSPRRRAPARLPDFIQIDEVPAGTAAEDVLIQHVRPDELRQHIDVQDKIVNQVDELVEYYNGLYHEDQMDIEELRKELSAKKQELSEANRTIQQLRVKPAPVCPDIDPYRDQGLWAAIKQAWRPKHTCWSILLSLLLLGLLLAILLPITLKKDSSQSSAALPSFSTAPRVVAVTSSSVDLSVGVSEATVLHYVMIPRQTGRRLHAGGGWNQYSSSDIAAAAEGWGTTSLEAMVAACGNIYVSNNYVTNTTLSISTQSTNECAVQRELYASGGKKPSCERCPMLQPAMTYDMLMVVGENGAYSEPIHLEVTTAPASSNTAPIISTVPTTLIGTTALPAANRSAGTVVASVAPTSENSFKLTFQLDIPGTVKYMVIYSSMHARFMDRYVIFSNGAMDVSSGLYIARSSFQDGVVARGEMQLSAARTDYTCTIGGNSGSNCTCSYGAACTQEIGCFGSLCDYSVLTITGNTTYKAVLIPVSQDGSTLGSPLTLGPFTTPPSTTPPTPSSAMAIAPAVGPDRFTIQNMQQDKPGFIHVVATQPYNQAYKLTAGTASGFTRIADAPGRRRLLSSTNTIRLPAEAGAAAAGTLFLPPCGVPLVCNASNTVTDFVNPLVEKIVFQKCMPLNTITEKTSMVVYPLGNATLYRVLTILSDTISNKAVWSAMVRTQDLTPPVLTVVDTPAPDFDKFSVAVQLDEPGTIYGGLLLASKGPQVSATATCEPTFTGPMVAVMNPVTVTQGQQPVSLSFDGLTANTDYLLKLIATDVYDNCQSHFTDLLIHTLDNVPPVTLAMNVVGVTGSSGVLQLTLDEPGTVYYLVLDNNAGSATCPSADQLFSLTVPNGVTLTSPSCLGNFTVPASNTPAQQNITGLTSQTPYLACAVALDATRLRNRQSQPTSQNFTTLDVTPPQLTVRPVPGSDGNFTCSRTTYLCSLLFTTKLNEPGDIIWALLPRASLPATLPTPQQVFSSSSNISAVLPGAIASDRLAAASTNTSITDVPSQTAYVLVLAARDAATAADGSPQPNYIARLAQLTLIAPDVTPPIFTDASISDVNDTQLTLNVMLNEDSLAYYVIVPHPSSFPTPSQVAAGQGVSGSVPTTAGTTAATAAIPTAFAAGGLSPGRFWDVYLVAEDAAGNLQVKVTSISNVRTTDSVPPIIILLSATFTPPMTFTLAANVSKSGWVIYAPRNATDPAPTAADVLLAFSSHNPALANFTASLGVPTAGVVTTGTQCVADGDQLVVYAVAQDNEGQYAGRQNNTSPLVSTAVQLVQPNFGSSCIPPVFLAPLRPSLSVTRTSLLPGLLLGQRSNTTSPTGVIWQQDAAGLVAANLQLTTKAGAVKLPGAIQIGVQPNPPAGVAVFVQNAVLMPDANGPDGSTIRLTYQLWDAAGRTQVDTSNIVVRPLLSYANNLTVPTGTTLSNNVLPDCDQTVIGPNSGVGQCSTAVSKTFFPASGSLAAKVVLKVYVGSTQVAVSGSSNIQLQAAPSIPAFNPSTPGLLVTLPYGPVYMGEVIKVTLEAVNSLAQGLTGFTIPLMYNMQQLSFVSAQLSGLWLTPSQAPVPGASGGNFYVVTLQTYGRAGNNPDSAYRSSSSIPLVDVYFRVIFNTAGTAANVIAINPAPSLFSFNPSWTNPYYQFNSFNGQGSTGALNIGAVSILGMWAWADTHDIFNTAALTGQRVTTVLRGVLVKTFGTMDVIGGDTVTGCVIMDGSGAATTLLDQTVCKLTVDVVNTVPDKGLPVIVSLPNGNQADVSAQVQLNVWYPSNLALSAADTTLNKVLPINAATPSASCLDMYQSTTLTLTADWSNGGTAAADTWRAADVTDLATYKSSNTNVAIIQTGGIVKGIHSGTTTISINPVTSVVPSPSLTITVSDNAVCLRQLSALATTGAALNASTVTALAATPARTAVRTPLSWKAQQQLVWEDSSALVLTYATFTDGSVMDVSGRAAVTAQIPSGVGVTVLPFSLGVESSTQLPVVQVNSTVGSNNTCQPYLSTSWSVCSLPLGSGIGTVRIKLPTPSAVAGFSATPTSITGAANVASLAPVSLPTSSSLALNISFSDGSVRGFSNDARTEYTVTFGAGLCNVVQASDGSWQVVATGNLPGLCEVTATATFPIGAPLTTSTRVWVVTMTKLEVAALDANTVTLPNPVASSELLPDDALLLLKCDARNYDTRTLWSLGVLSNCTSNNTCPMVSSINDARYLALSSSNTAVADIMTGFPGQPNYPTYGLLGNRLVPYKAGTTTASITLGSNTTGVTALTRNIAVAVKDTYQPTWPTAAATSDTSVAVAANMSDLYTVTYEMVVGSKLDLVTSPPRPSTVETAGVSMVADATQGPYYFAATASGLQPGTNYTMLSTVRQGSTLSPGLTALTGVLVPDTTPPSFTKSVVKVPATPSVITGDWTVQVDIALNEQGKVFFAIYGDPDCITGDPSYNDVKRATNLADPTVNKCNCSASYCQAVSSGEIDFPGSTTSDVVTMNAVKPPFPFDDLPTVATCIQYAASQYASKDHAVYFVAEDNLPTYKGWISSCSMPVVSQNTLPTPCAAVTVGRCNNTPPAVETVNQQALPYAGVDMYPPGSAAAAPPRSPVKGVITVVDTVPAGFQQAYVNSTGSAVVFTFQTSKIGLVMWRLVEQVVVEIANGYVAVRDSSVINTVKVDRKCSGVPLVSGTAYALWFNMTDIYGSTTDINILQIKLQ